MAVPDLTGGSCQPGNHKLSPDAWTGDGSLTMRREVVRACQECPVLEPCRAWVISEMPESPGHAAAETIIMAGMTRAERQAARGVLRGPGPRNRRRGHRTAAVAAHAGLASAAAVVPPAAAAVVPPAAAAVVPPAAAAVAAHAGLASAAAVVLPAWTSATTEKRRRAMAALLRDHQRSDPVIGREAGGSKRVARMARRELEDAGLIDVYRDWGGGARSRPPRPERLAVTAALLADPARSNREIAAATGVAHSVVMTARHALEEAGTIPVWRHRSAPRRPAAVAPGLTGG